VLPTFDERAFHAPSAEQHEDATFDASTEPLAAFERPAFLEGFPVGATFAARLRNARELPPAVWHASRLASLKKPRSELYRSGAWPKRSAWQSSDGVRCGSWDNLPLPSMRGRARAESSQRAGVYACISSATASAVLRSGGRANQTRNSLSDDAESARGSAHLVVQRQPAIFPLVAAPTQSFNFMR
jgi:hypothetical protein